MKRAILPHAGSSWWTDQYRKHIWASMSQLGCERPAKKRRFFVEDPEDVSSPASVSVEEAGEHVDERGTGHGEPPKQFDSQTLQAFVGENLEPSVIDKLRLMSDGDIERGMKCRNCFFTFNGQLITYSNKYIFRWFVERKFKTRRDLAPPSRIKQPFERYRHSICKQSDRSLRQSNAHFQTSKEVYTQEKIYWGIWCCLLGHKKRHRSCQKW